MDTHGLGCSVCFEPIGSRPAFIVVPVTDQGWQRSIHDAWTGIIVHHDCMPGLRDPLESAEAR